MREAEIHTSPKTQNMGNVDFHSTGKVWKKTNIPKLWVSQIFWVKQKSIQFLKHGKRQWTPIVRVREKYGKTQTFQIYGFLKYLGLSRNP